MLASFLFEIVDGDGGFLKIPRPHLQFWNNLENYTYTLV